MLSTEFGRAFWEFVKLGQYEQQEKSSGEKQFYRFQKPATDGYPFMLELFSRSQDGIEVPEDCHLTPIPVSDEVSSLSAILLDEVYYAWIKAGKAEIDGISIAGPECIIPLKAIAWLDLTDRKANGESIDSRAIKKHKNDIFRLSQIIDPEAIPEVPEKFKKDLNKFIKKSMEDESIDLKALGIKGQSKEDIFKYFEDSYKLNS